MVMRSEVDQLMHLSARINTAPDAFEVLKKFGKSIFSRGRKHNKHEASPPPEQPEASTDQGAPEAVSTPPPQPPLASGPVTETAPQIEAPTTGLFSSCTCG